MSACSVGLWEILKQKLYMKILFFNHFSPSLWSQFLLQYKVLPTARSQGNSIMSFFQYYIVIRNRKPEKKAGINMYIFFLSPQMFPTLGKIGYFTYSRHFTTQNFSTSTN